MAETIYVSKENLTRYDGKIKQVITDADAKVLKDAKAYADGLADNYDAAGTAITKVQELANGAVKDNTDAIAKLNGADTVEGSVAKAIKDVKTELEGKITASEYDDTDIKARVSTVEGEIDTLNGTGAGSVKKQIADAMSAQTFLTKEIATAEEITAYTGDPTLAKFNVIYLLEDTTAKGSDKYFEYQRIGSMESSSFRMTGDTSTDLSDYAKFADVNKSLDGKVDKAEGMGLSQNSYTTTEKTKLSGIAEGANKTTVTASAETLTITIN